MSKNYFQKEVWSDYLGKSKVLKAQSQWELQIKVDEQYRKWSVEEQRQRERERTADLKEHSQLLTVLALKEIEEYRSILKATLSKDDRLEWDTLYDKKPYKAFDYKRNLMTLEEIHDKFRVPKKSIWEIFIKPIQKKRIRLEEQATIEFQRLTEVEEIRYVQALSDYESQKLEYDEKQQSKNKEIDVFKLGFEEGHGEDIENYVRMVLERSQYPENFDKVYEIAFDPIGEVLVINYTLPKPTDLPNIEEYKFVTTRKEIVPKEMKKKDYEGFYEDFIYQLTLRTIHEVFESVYIDHVSSVVFNGWIQGIDAATGNEFTSCVLSCQADRKTFESFNLALVSPKECVRNLKGLVAGALHQLTPVRPIMDLRRDDSRFVESKNVLDGMQPSSNLAEMEWGDFEHLVRELFSKIFNRDGGEVKVTQASRDGGVDAIAFDPDNIRGGKFVIQAKRYNNVVPVSAVRDLYGTMISEGAVKGILVTTSHFGPDSRAFVKDKPITLIDGSNLVYMLQEHGYNVTIRTKNR